jgi:hypothetical protein
MDKLESLIIDDDESLDDVKVLPAIITGCRGCNGGHNGSGYPR